jgi:hypothetical protein
LFTPTQSLFVLYRNRHADSMHVFRLSSIEIFKITNQNTVLALLYPFTCIYSDFFGRWHPNSLWRYNIVYRYILFPLSINWEKFISYTKHWMLFAFFFLIDSLLIITYFKWRLLAADPAKHPNYIVTLSNKCWKVRMSR